MSDRSLRSLVFNASRFTLCRTCGSGLEGNENSWVEAVEHFWTRLTRLPRLSMAYPSWDSRGKRPLIARTPIFPHRNFIATPTEGSTLYPDVATNMAQTLGL